MKPPAIQSRSFFRVDVQRTDLTGFTVVGLLVAILILGLLFGLAALPLVRQFSNPQHPAARESIEKLSSLIYLYKLDVGTFPSSEQGLSALIIKPAGAENWFGPYIKGGTLPIDPWKRKFIYRHPSGRNGYDYDLCLTGQDEEATAEGIVCN